MNDPLHYLAGCPELYDYVRKNPTATHRWNCFCVTVGDSRINFDQGLVSNLDPNQMASYANFYLSLPQSQEAYLDKLFGILPASIVTGALHQRLLAISSLLQDGLEIRCPLLKVILIL